MIRHSIVLVLLAGISVLVSNVGADDEHGVKRPQPRRIASGPLPFQGHIRSGANGARDGRRPRPSLPAPPYAVQMEPLVQYSQRDPLYHQKNAINITASSDNKLGLSRADSQPESTNSISDTLNSLSEAQNRYDNPYPPHHHYYKEPEPIIEIIIKESNESLPAPPTPAPVQQLPPKKEPVQVFYIKYKKNPNSHGKNGEDDIIYEPPVPALTPPPGELEGDTEHESHIDHHEHHSPTPAPPPPPPPPSTTLRTIIHPDSEVFHGSGLHVTFGESETHYSDAEQEEQSAPEPSISLPTPQGPAAQNRDSSGVQIKRQQQFPPYNPLQPGTYQTPPPPPSPQSSFPQPSQSSSFAKEQFPRQISQHQQPAFRPQHTSSLISQPHSSHNHAHPSQTPQFASQHQQPKFQQSAQQIQLNHNNQQQQRQQNQQFSSNGHGNNVRLQNVRQNQPSQQFQQAPQQTHQAQRPFYKSNDQAPPRQHFHQPVAQATHQHTQLTHQSELTSPSNNVQYSQFRSQPIHVQAQPNTFKQSQHHHHHIQGEQKNQHTQYNQQHGQRQGLTQAHFQQPQPLQQNNQQVPINLDHSKHQQGFSPQPSIATIQSSSHVQQPTSVNFPAIVHQRPKSQLQIEFERQQQLRQQQLQQPQQQQQQQNIQQQPLNLQQHQQQQYKQQQQYQQQHHQPKPNHQSQQQQSIINLQQQKQSNVNIQQQQHQQQQYQAQPQLNVQKQQQQFQSYNVNQQKQTPARPARPSQYQSQQFQGNQAQSQKLNNYQAIQNNHQQANLAQNSHFNNQPTPSSGEIIKSIPKLEDHQIQSTPQPSPVYFESSQQTFTTNQRKVPQKSSHRHNQLEQQQQQQGVKYNKEPVYTTQRPFISSTTLITPKPFKTYVHQQPSSTTAQTITQDEDIAQEQNEKILYERREKEKKKHEQNIAALPSEVPDDLREQLLSSGILGNADIQILDYDKVGDIPIESLPPEALENLYGAGSAPVPAVATPEESAAKTPVEMKVVRYDPTTKEGQTLAETYVKEDATQLDPVVLNDSRYNRYLPLKVNGTNFPLPDAPQLDGRIINSVVVLAPVDYDFVHPPEPSTDGDRDGRSTPIQVQGVRFIAGDILKDLVKEPTKDNYVSWLEKEKSTPTERQSVVLLVTSSSNKENGKDKEIFMYDVNSTRISKLRGELSSAFVDVAESNAQSQDLDGLSSAAATDASATSDEQETEMAASEFQSYRIASPSPVYQPQNIKLAGFSNRDIDLAMSASEPELQQVEQDNTNFGDKLSILSGYSRMKEY